jgi:hypothetical protein
MIPKLAAAEYVGEHRVRVRFADGAEAVLDLAAELWGEVFEPLKDPALFGQLRFDPELNTIVWPTGADLAPEYLYSRVLAEQPDTAIR